MVADQDSQVYLVIILRLKPICHYVVIRKIKEYLSAFLYKNGKVWHFLEGRKWLRSAGSGQILAKSLIGQGQVGQPFRDQ